jgi:DNA ligase-1
MISRPMLAAKIDDPDYQIKFPVLASPKLDGIRCLVLDGGRVVSRRLKPIPNKSIRSYLAKYCPPGLDGELMLPEMSGNFQQVTSIVMSRDGGDEWEYCVFDNLAKIHSKKPEFEYRITSLDKLNIPKVRVVPHLMLHDDTELSAYEKVCLRQGYEGVMLRDPDGPYKQGRSTLREGYLIKLKRFTDSEAIVIGYEERCRNENEAKVNELGYSKRSSHKANKVPAGTLGSLVCRDIKSDVEFNVGTGFDDALRAKLWAQRKRELKGKVIKYRYQAHGVKDKPRMPVFLGFRDPIDM